MERAIEAGYPAPMLTVQYRMHPSICAPISAAFYGNRLLTDDHTALLRPKVSRRGGPARWVQCQMEETAIRNGGYYNEGEADVVVQQLRKAMASSGKTRSIFIITFYNAQKRLIEERVREIYGPDVEVAVLSVDSVQGSEADVAILSTVRSHTRSQVRQQ